MPFSTKSSTCMYRDVNNRIIITLQLLDNLWTFRIGLCLLLKLYTHEA